ncbi:MAG: 3'-5' exonuclease, partial [Bacteroidales bacterium]
KVNKIDLIEHDKKAQPVDRIRDEFLDIVNSLYRKEKVQPTVIGHNVAFDLGFIHEHLFSKSQWDKIVSYRNIDTAGVARFLIECGIIECEKTSLDGLIEYFFDRDCKDHPDRHSALWDARATWEVYKELAVNTIS